MTRKMEEKLKQIEDGKITADQVIENTKKDLELVLKSLKDNDKNIGKMLTSASNKIDNKSRENIILRKCTICLDGTLMITSNWKNRALVCSRSMEGKCIVKASLPRSGYIRTQKNGCVKCSWPKIRTTYKGRPWSFCSNPDCHNERKRK